jgi:transcriptional regulator with XRE-family HTH domain
MLSMTAMDLLGAVRRRAGLSQRRLAVLAGLPQSTISRIERGAIDPRISTMRRLLQACGYDLEARPRPGKGVDRSLIRGRLQRSPLERLEDMAFASEAIAQLRRSARKVG